MYRTIQLNKVALIVGVAILGLLMVSAAQATIIAQHLGNTDPSDVSEGFRGHLVGSCSADVGPPLNWKMYHAAGANGFYVYDPATITGCTLDPITTADFDDPTGWTWTSHAFGGAPRTQNDGYLQAATYIRDGHSFLRIDMFLDGGEGKPGGVHVCSDFTKVAQFGTVDPGAAWHTYQIYMNPGATPAADVFEMYLDGTACGTFTRAALPTDAGAQFLWGKATALDTPAVTQQYAIQRLETGKHIIPEPSSIVLLAFGLIGLLCYAWRKQK